MSERPPVSIAKLQGQLALLPDPVLVPKDICGDLLAAVAAALSLRDAIRNEYVDEDGPRAALDLALARFTP